MSQRDRVKRALDNRGPRGVSPVDFQSPTIDGGPPILRVAARIYELRQTYDIAELKGEDGCALYLYRRYVSGAVGEVGGTACHADENPSSASPSASEPTSLFDAPATAPRNAIFEDAA